MFRLLSSDEDHKSPDFQLELHQTDLQKSIFICINASLDALRMP
jgi:hypothetical protein